MTLNLAGALASLGNRSGGSAGLETIWTVLPAARLVGGVVRDLLADRPVADLDLATPEPPEIVLQRLRGQGIKVLPTGIAHGTVTAMLGGQPFEITTLRRDVETDGRHAVVAWTDDWREDAARRDFTINAMSLGRDGILHDYFGGAADLAGRQVRFVGQARARIEEDALRILRFFRFQARYGGGEPDPEAVRAIGQTVQMLGRLSAERIWSELRRLLQDPDPVASMRLMHRLEVLAAILPEGGDVERLAALVRLHAPADPVLRLAAVARGPARIVARALKLSNLDAERLAALRTGPRPEPSLDDDGLRRLLADDAPDLLADRGWLAEIEPGADAPGAWNVLRSRLLAMPRPVFPLGGRDAVASGLPAGPAVGEALRRVRAWWWEAGCRASHDACLSRLRAG